MTILEARLLAEADQLKAGLRDLGYFRGDQDGAGSVPARPAFLVPLYKREDTDGILSDHYVITFWVDASNFRWVSVCWSSGFGLSKCHEERVRMDGSGCLLERVREVLGVPG